MSGFGDNQRISRVFHELGPASELGSTVLHLSVSKLIVTKENNGVTGGGCGANNIGWKSAPLCNPTLDWWLANESPRKVQDQRMDALRSSPVLIHVWLTSAVSQRRRQRFAALTILILQLMTGLICCCGFNNNTVSETEAPRSVYLWKINHLFFIVYVIYVTVEF